MPKYAVTIQAVVVKTYEVEAADQDEAEIEAQERFNVDPETGDSYEQETVDIRLIEPETVSEPDADTLFLALRNLYADYARYYPSAVENSPVMKAVREILENGR